MRLEAIHVVLDPTPAQERRLNSHVGAARIAYNWGRQHLIDQIADGNPTPDYSMYALRKAWNSVKTTVCVRADGTTWVRENSKEAYSSGLQAVSDAMRNHVNSLTGRRKGKPAGFPKRRTRKSGAGYTYTTGSFGTIEDDPYGLKLPRIGRVHTTENVLKRVGGRRVRHMTIRCDHHRWVALLTVEAPSPADIPHKVESVGIDMGVRHYMTLSDGTVLDMPDTSRLDRKIRLTQRAINREEKDSGHQQRNYGLLGRLCDQRYWIRHDFIGKATTMIARTYGHVGIEDLNVSGMTSRPKAKPDPEHPGKWLRNGRRAKAGLDRSILLMCFRETRRQLEYKCPKYGSELTINDRWFASSKTCAMCGATIAKLPLSQRTYHCASCGSVLDRDLNAAINLNPVAPSAVGDVKRAWRMRKTRLCRATSESPACRGGSVNQAPVCEAWS